MVVLYKKKRKPQQQHQGGTMEKNNLQSATIFSTIIYFIFLHFFMVIGYMIGDINIGLFLGFILPLKYLLMTMIGSFAIIEDNDYEEAFQKMRFIMKHIPL